MRKQHGTLKRLGAIALSVAIAVSFMPLFDGVPAYAADTDGQELSLTIDGMDANMKEAGVDEEMISTMAKDTGYSEDAIAAALNGAGVNTPEQAESPEASIADADIPDAKVIGEGTEGKIDLPVNTAYKDYSASGLEPGMKGSDEEEGDEGGDEEVTGEINVDFDQKSGTALVTGWVTGDEFYYLCVDGEQEIYIGGTEIYEELDMRDYKVGFHDISADLYNSDKVFHYQYVVPTLIYKKPSNKLKFYWTGKNYFTISGFDSYYYDYTCPMYLEYKKGKGKWSKPQGPLDYSKTSKKKGLKPKKQYSVRLYYGKAVKYGGETYFISGKDLGKVSGVQKIKTASNKKPPVRSLTTSGAKQWYRTLTIHYYSGGMYLYSRTYKIYYTEFKVTLKMKKKPGTTGIYIGSKKMKGNKKLYKTKFLLSGKQKGKKLKFCVQSYQHKVYGGYSPTWHKKIKIR